MATIMEELTGLLSSSVTEALGKSVGLKSDLVSKGIGTVGPLVTAALAKKTSTSAGQAELMQLLPKDGTAAILGNLAKGVSGSSDTRALSWLLGNGQGAVETTLDRSLGFKASALLPAVTPLILGLVSKLAAENNLGANAISGILAGDAADFRMTGGESSRLVNEALDAGRRATDVRAQYSPLQWDSVRLAPVAAAQVVIMADQSGPMGVAKEMRAATSAIADARNSAPPDSLLGLAFDHDFSVEELSKFTKAKTPDDVLATVRDAMSVVERNSPSDAPAYRQLVADVATRVANATKEGGVLGIGGVAVSPAEQVALDQLRSAIGDR